MIKYITTFICCFLCVNSYAILEQDLIKITTQNGLADNTVLALDEDELGFLWVGTENGLSRYDGKFASSFKYNGRVLKIQQLSAQDKQYIWLLANRKLVAFDKKREAFTPVTLNSEEVTASQFYFDQQKQALWILDKESLTKYSYNVTTDGITLAPIKTTDETISATLFTPYRSDMLILTSSDELLTLQADNTVTKLTNLPQLKHTSVRGMKVLNNSLWLYTYDNGLLIIDLFTLKHIHIDYNINRKIAPNLGHSDVYDVIQSDQDSYIAVGWNGYTRLTKQVDGYYTTEVFDNTYSIIHQNLETHMLAVHYNPNGILWIGTAGGGLYQSDTRKIFYNKYLQDGPNEICAVEHDEKGYIYLGTYHKGLLKSSQPLSTHQTLQFESIKTPIKRVLSFAKQGQNIWMAGQGDTLVKYNTNTGKIESFTICNSNNNRVEIRSMCIDSDSIIWMGATNQLFKFDITNKKCIAFPKTVGQIRAILTVEGGLWLGTSIGVVYYDTNENQYIDSDDNLLPRDQVLSIYRVKNGQIYIGYINQLVSCHNTKLKQFASYDMKDGLSNSSIHSISEDNNGNIWLATNSSITRYDRNKHLFYNFYISSSNRASAAYNHFILFGNNINLTYIDNNLIDKKDNPSAPIQITNLLFNRSIVHAGDEFNKQQVLTQGISYTDDLVLSPENTTFTLYFSDLQYNTHQKYQYRLYPYHSSWNLANESEGVFIEKLPKGNYTFQVRKVNDEGSAPITSLNIEVLPKWYETTYFQILLCCIVLVVIFLIYKWFKIRHSRKEKERELKQELLLVNLEKEKERKLNNEREAFFTQMAHEFRTPLALIEGPICTLQQQLEDADTAIKNNLTLIANNTSALSNMLEQLFDLHKMQVGITKIKRSCVEIGVLTQDIVNSFIPMAKQNHINLKFTDNSSGANIFADATRIASLLQNLLSNALKYSPEYSNIFIQLDLVTHNNNMMCKIMIQDEGIGMSKELISSVFKAYQIGTSKANFSTSLGLGLQIVQQIVTLHHGDIVLESEENKGTIFNVYLPLGNKKEQYTTSSSHTPKTHKQSILIIEDNEEMRGYIRSLFETKYRIYEAENGLQGIETAKLNRPNLVLCDVMMPIIDGFEVLKQLKADTKTADLPILMLTAKSEDEDYLLSIRSGAEGFIKKPFNPDLLQTRVQNIIEMRERLKRVYQKSLMLTDAPENESDAEAPFMQEVINCIEANLDNAEFGVKELAETLCMSQSTLYRRLKELSDLSANKIIRQVRITKAAALLLQGNYQVQEVAELVGYIDVESFRKHFMAQFNIQPSLFKANYKD